MAERIESIKQTNICVCSFSEEGDLLSQWRGYCPSGAGFSIGFDSQQLRSLAEKQNFRLWPCEYNQEVQKKVMEEMLKTEFSRFDMPISDEVRLIAALSAVMKHNSFSEEREWRLVSGMLDSRNTQFGFRKGQSVIVPYFKFTLSDGNKPLPIKRLVIGPTPHPDLARDSVGMILARKGVTEWQVENSVIPYRNW